jgi:meiotic recombination protein SPO11
MATGGETIPSNIEGLHSLRTDAKMILIVEKDAVFQTLLQDSSLKMLQTIFITGKGVPDLNTRQLLHR